MPQVSVSDPGVALLNIPDAIRYLGSMSRAKFYADILPHVDTVKLGKRTLIVVESLDKFIDAHRVEWSRKKPIKKT